MKRLLLLQVIFVLFNLKLNATDQEVDLHMPNPSVLNNFAQDRNLIYEYLEQVKDAQLHCFWTTGRTISDNPDYKPVTDVEVGGPEYGKKFFPYVEWLLNNSPDKLKVMFTCDKMTAESNEQQIRPLLSYNNRFNLLLVTTVHQNLLKTFSEEEQKHKINVLFKNATQGSPVITSDSYRIIGMIYGQDNPSDSTGALRTYCDIDAFCFGMESNSHTKLIEALFKPVFKVPFYFGMSFNNNDIIKICISEMDSYKEFCDRQLTKIKLHRKIFPQYNTESVISHFSKLHDIIKKCEEDPIYCSNVVFFIPDPIHKLIQEVTQNTGPQFLYDNNIDKDLSYPSVTVGAWGAPEEILDYRNNRYASTKPASVLDWGYSDATPEEKEAEEKFNKDCDQYRKYLGAYFYAKKFGENHPFNIEIKKYLLNYYPYHRESFKTLLKLNFNFHKKESDRSYEVWKNHTFKGITIDRSWGHYTVLTGLLKKVGIEIPMTLESLDF